MARTTLRQLNGFDDTPAALADSTVIMVDFQNTYTKGVMELDGWEPALDAGAGLLAAAREAGATVIHIVNDGGDGTPYDIHAEIGQIHPKVAPIEARTTCGLKTSTAGSSSAKSRTPNASIVRATVPRLPLSLGLTSKTWFAV